MENQTKTALPFSLYRQRKHNLMVDTILDTARLIMREQGVSALTMQELARKLDIRAPSLYNYFPSKLAIYDSLFRLGFTLYSKEVEQVVQDSQPITWQEYIRQTFERYMLFAIENPDLYQLCFERPVPGFVPSEESLKISFDILHRSYEKIAELKNDLVTDLNPQQLVDFLIAVMHGLTAMHMSNEPQLPVGEGRFGSLIPAALEVLEKAWTK